MLRESGRLDEAVAACRRAIAIQPGFAKAWGNLGNVLKEQGKFNEAIGAYRRVMDHPKRRDGCAIGLGWESGAMLLRRDLPVLVDDALGGGAGEGADV